MKKTFVICSFIILMLALISCKKSDEHTEFEFEWALGENYSDPPVFEDGYKIIKYTGSDSVITIPPTYKGKAVRYIGADVFKDNTTIIKIILPKTLLIFAASAFKGTTNLTEISVDGEIGDRYVSRDGILYAMGYPKENGTLILGFVPLGRTKDIVIESDVTHISGFTFDGVYGIENITINSDSSLTSISKLFTNFGLDVNYKLKNIFVDENQYDSLIELFSFRNEDLISMISVRPQEWKSFTHLYSLLLQ